jgi:hypothetical protein
VLDEGEARMVDEARGQAAARVLFERSRKLRQEMDRA